MNKKCEKCRFIEVLANRKDWGYCHRYPPTPDGKNIFTRDNFPVLSIDDWCGEFQKKGKK